MFLRDKKTEIIEVDDAGVIQNGPFKFCTLKLNVELPFGEEIVRYETFLHFDKQTYVFQTKRKINALKLEDFLLTACSDKAINQFLAIYMQLKPMNVPVFSQRILETFLPKSFLESEKATTAFKQRLDQRMKKFSHDKLKEVGQVLKDNVDVCRQKLLTEKEEMKKTFEATEPPKEIK